MNKRKRRPLSPDELAACEEFRRLLLASPKSQEQIASEIGVTQGAVWQWAEGKIPIASGRARAAAAAVDGDPRLISAAFRALHVAEPAPTYGTGAVLLIPEMLAVAESWVRFEERSGRVFQPVRRAERLIEIYRDVVADGGSLTPDHAEELITAAHSRTGKQGKEDGRHNDREASGSN